MKSYIFFILCFSVLNSNSQEKNFKDWLPQEIEYYKTLKDLGEYINGKDMTEISKDTLLKKYIYIDEGILKNNEVPYTKTNFEYIFSFIPKTIKKYGIENLDTKPVRFYKDNKIYRPFERALKDAVPLVMVYYRKDRPDEPLGTLLFDAETHKLASWILLSQGGSGWYYY